MSEFWLVPLIRKGMETGVFSIPLVSGVPVVVIIVDVIALIIFLTVEVSDEQFAVRRT